MLGRPWTRCSRANVAATVILDLYGTLVEPDWPTLLRGRAALASRVGIPPEAAHRAWDTTHLARMSGAYGSLADDLHAVFSEAAGGCAAPASRSLLLELAAQERENWRGGVRLFPETFVGLRRLRSAGHLLAIVTNASAEAASVIEGLGLTPLVDAVLASCDAGVLKPELLEFALRSLRIDARGSFAVDDEPAQLDHAAELGMGTILVRRKGAEAPPAAVSPHLRASDLEHAADLVAGAQPGPRQ